MATIKFQCPVCEARHERGYIDGVALFRCLQCGYQGYGYHPDAGIDRDVHLDVVAANECNERLGLPTENIFERWPDGSA